MAAIEADLRLVRVVDVLEAIEADLRLVRVVDVLAVVEPRLSSLSPSLSSSPSSSSLSFLRILAASCACEGFGWDI